MEFKIVYCIVNFGVGREWILCFGNVDREIFIF